MSKGHHFEWKLLQPVLDSIPGFRVRNFYCYISIVRFLSWKTETLGITSQFITSRMWSWTCSWKTFLKCSFPTRGSPIVTTLTGIVAVPSTLLTDRSRAQILANAPPSECPVIRIWAGLNFPARNFIISLWIGYYQPGVFRVARHKFSARQPPPLRKLRSLADFERPCIAAESRYEPEYFAMG